MQKAEIFSHLHWSRAHQNAFFTVSWITPLGPSRKETACCTLQCKLVISHTAVQNLVSSRRTEDESKRETCPFNNRRQRFSSYAAALSQFEDTEIERLHGKFHSLMHPDEMSPNQWTWYALSGGFIWYSGEMWITTTKTCAAVWRGWERNLCSAILTQRIN